MATAIISNFTCAALSVADGNLYCFGHTRSNVIVTSLSGTLITDVSNGMSVIGSIGPQYGLSTSYVPSNKSVYFNYVNYIVKFDTTTRTMTKSFVDSGSSMTSDGTYLYVVRGGEYGNTAQYNLAGTVTNIAYFPTNTTVIGSIGGMACDGSFIYCGDGSGVTRINISTKVSNKKWISGLNSVNSTPALTIDASYLYVGLLPTGTTANIGQYSLATGSYVASLNYPAVSQEVSCITSDGTNLYVQHQAQPLVYKVPRYAPPVVYYPCFLEGTKILTLKGEYVPVETLRRGDLVKTSTSGYKAVSLIGRAVLNRPASDPEAKNRLFRYTQHTCPELFEDLCVTGEHCALVNHLSAEKLAEVKEHMGDIYVTEGDYRIPACLDERAMPYSSDAPATIWHFALEHPDIYSNYGVFANGLLVESASQQYLEDLSNMKMVE
jgi:hypothetical protein